MFSLFSGSSVQSKTKVVDKINEGPNMSQVAMSNIYGWFLDRLNKTSSTEEDSAVLMQQFQSPLICVVGCESTGKSSTIESMCKVPIFPSNSGICTRCPVRMVLDPCDETEENAYTLETRFTSDGAVRRTTYTDTTLCDLRSTVQMWFHEIENAHSTSFGYSETEIVIHIRRSDVARLEFVDLPGIVSYPPNAMVITERIATKYIQDRNTFLLCVANATTPRLTSYSPIRLIMQSDACARTILVLPMADKVVPKDFETHLLNRLSLKSDELENMPFAACCAVVNRTVSDGIGLAEQAVAEEKWFTDHLVVPLLTGIETANLPDAEKLWRAQLLDLVKQQTGVANLLKVTNVLYDRYIITEWVPKTIADLRTKIAKMKQDVVNLGVLVTTDNVDDLKEKFKYPILHLGVAQFFNKSPTRPDVIDKVLTTPNIDMDNNAIAMAMTCESLFLTYDEHEDVMNKGVYIQHIPHCPDSSMLPLKHYSNMMADIIHEESETLVENWFVPLMERLMPVVLAEELVCGREGCDSRTYGVARTELECKIRAATHARIDTTALESWCENADSAETRAKLTAQIAGFERVLEEMRDVQIKKTV